jgi:hypothetical protein
MVRAVFLAVTEIGAWRKRNRGNDFFERWDRGETDFSNTLSAGCQQRTKNKKKAIKHDEPN